MELKQTKDAILVIKTKYIAGTYDRGAKIKATVVVGNHQAEKKYTMVEFDHSLTNENRHKRAVIKLLHKLVENYAIKESLIQEAEVVVIHEKDAKTFSFFLQ